jgi:hypothetical protein
MSKRQNSVLSPEEATQKRNQLVNDGFCVVPGILRGEMLERVRQFTDQFFYARRRF